MKNSQSIAATKRTEILSELSRIQGHAGDRYVARGPWRMRARELTAGSVTARLSRSRIPGLGPKVVGGLLAQAICRRHIDLPVQNEALQLADSGDRVRTFDPDEGASRKLVVRDSKYGRGVEADLDVRTTLLVDAGVPHPRVRTSERRRDHILVDEELVSGRRFMPPIDRHRIPEGLMAPLARLYEQAGVKRVALTDWLGPDLAGALAAIDDPEPALRHARHLVDRNPMVSLGFGHGDLLPSNLAVRRRDVCFLDWETAGYAPIGFDLLRLWRKYPRVSALADSAADLVKRYQTGPLDLRDTASLSLAIGYRSARSKRAWVTLARWSQLTG